MSNTKAENDPKAIYATSEQGLAYGEPGKREPPYAESEASGEPYARMSSSGDYSNAEQGSPFVKPLKGSTDYVDQESNGPYVETGRTDRPYVEGESGQEYATGEEGPHGM